MLLLVMTSQSFDVVKNNSQFKTAQAPLSANTFWSCSKCSKCPPRAFTYSLNLFFLNSGTVLLIEPAENCPVSSPVRLSIQNLFRLRIKKSDIRSLDFVVDRFFMKLFNTNNIYRHH